MTEYSVSKSISVLDVMFTIFRLDKSKEDISLLVASRLEDSSEGATEYALNIALFPSIVISLWCISMVCIIIIKRLKCCRRCRWRLGGRSPAYNGDFQDPDLITIISNENVWVRGAAGDKIRYEILCSQMGRRRNAFSLLVVVTVVISIPAMLASLYLKDTHQAIVREANHMAYRLGAANASIAFITEKRKNLLGINDEITAQLQTSEFQACLAEHYISQASLDLAQSIGNMAERIDESEMLQQQQIFSDAHDVAKDAESSLKSLSYAMWVLIISIIMLNIAATLLFLGTSIAKRNSKETWHHTVFQSIAYPILVGASMMLMIAFVALGLGGIAVVDFCSSDEGSPSSAIQSILAAGGYKDSIFYEHANVYMMVRNFIDFDSSILCPFLY